MDSQSVLLQPLKMGSLTLKNRIVMAPMSRCRAPKDTLVIPDYMVEYFEQRASAGLIITECCPISKRCGSWVGNGGIYTDDQQNAWKKVVDAVHKKGGLIFMQIFHAGRASHTTTNFGLEPWAPSPIAPKLVVGLHETPEVPHEMTKEEIKTVVQEFKNAAQRAKNAGFDGIELHGAHGYLIDQFLRNSANKRSDEYGGSIENRCRFILEVFDACAQVFDSNRIGLKVSPAAAFNDMIDSDPIALYTHLLKELSKKNMAFIELKNDQEPENSFGYGLPASKTIIPDVYKQVRPAFDGIVFGNNQFTIESAEEAVKNKIVDAVAFGTLYISNPDLVERVKNNWKLNMDQDKNAYFRGDTKGLSDYPFYDEWIKTQQ